MAWIISNHLRPWLADRVKQNRHSDVAGNSFWGYSYCERGHRPCWINEINIMHFISRLQGFR